MGRTWRVSAVSVGVAGQEMSVSVSVSNTREIQPIGGKQPRKGMHAGEHDAQRNSLDTCNVQA